MNTIESQSTIIAKDATSKQFLRLSISQLLLYLLVSVILLAVLNAKHAWDYLSKNIFSEQGGLGHIVPQTSWLGHTLNSLAHSAILQIVFWIVIGCLVYVILWFVRNIITNLMNDIAADGYIHPATYRSYLFWRSVLIRKVFSVISLLVWIIYIGIFIRTVMELAKLCHGILTDYITLNNLLELLGAVVLTVGLVYFLVLIARVVIYSWRSIYRDL